MNFINYQFKKLYRSYSYIPPYGFFTIWIMLFYFYKDQLILSSFASSSVVLFATISWLTIRIFNLESIHEKYLLFIQLGSKLKYMNYKILFSFLSSIPMVLFSILYPIITNRFSEKFDLITLVLSIYIHFIIMIIAILIASFFTIQKFLSHKYSWLFLIMIYILSIIKFAIIKSYPVFKLLLFFIPPVGDFLNLFNKKITDKWINEFIHLNIEIFLFVFIVFFLINYIFKKSEYY